MTLLKRLAWFMGKEGLVKSRWFRTNVDVEKDFLKEYMHVLNSKNTVEFGHSEEGAHYVSGSVLAGTLGKEHGIEHVIEKLEACKEDFRTRGLKAKLQHTGKDFLILLKTKRGFEKSRRTCEGTEPALADILDGMWMFNPWMPGPKSEK